MPVMNCDAMPMVEAGGRTFTDGEQGYADALRGLISNFVQRAREETGVGLRIEFVPGMGILRESI